MQSTAYSTSFPFVGDYPTFHHFGKILRKIIGLLNFLENG